MNNGGQSECLLLEVLHIEGDDKFMNPSNISKLGDDLFILLNNFSSDVF